MMYLRTLLVSVLILFRTSGFSGLVRGWRERLKACWIWALAHQLPRETSPSPLVTLVLDASEVGAKDMERISESLSSQDQIAELIVVGGHADPGSGGRIVSGHEAAIAAARGGWIGYLDRRTELAPGALRIIAKALRELPDAQALCTDAFIDAPPSPRLWLRPAFDPVSYENGEIGGLRLYRKSFLNRSVRPQGLEKATTVLSGSNTAHLPYPAVILHDSPEHRQRPVRKAPGPETSVSIIIPNRNACRLLGNLIDGLCHRTDYPSTEIVIVDNGSDEPDILSFYDRMRAEEMARIVDLPGPFNFSAMVNRGVEAASGSLILLLNNDIEIVHADWLSEMVASLVSTGAGIVGARLLYPDGRIQHAGVTVGMSGLADHRFRGMTPAEADLMGLPRVRSSVSAVTAACMLISRECWADTGSFDEQAFAVAYNDVDFCLRAGKCGHRIVWTPDATLVHLEGASRGSGRFRKKPPGLVREQENLRRLHRTAETSDPAYSPWLTPKRKPGFRRLMALPAPRFWKLGPLMTLKK